MTIILRLQNLPWSASSVDIRKFFVGVSIPDGGVHIVGGELGDVFVAFDTDEDARRAFGMNNQPLCGSKVSLMLSSKNEMMEVIAKSRAAAQKDVFSSPAPAAASQAPAAIPERQNAQTSSGHGYRDSREPYQGNRASDPLSGRQPMMPTPASRPMDAAYGYGANQYGNQQYGGSQHYGEQPYGSQSYGSRQASEPSTGAGSSVANTPAATEGYSGRMSGSSRQPKDPYAPGGEALGGQPVPGRSAEPQEDPPKRERSRWDQDPTQWQRGSSRWDNDSRDPGTSGRVDGKASRFGVPDAPAHERDRSRDRDMSKDREHVREKDRDRDVRERQRSQGFDERLREDRPSSRQSSHSSGIQGLDSALEALRQQSSDTASNPDSPYDRSNKRAPLLDSPLVDKANPLLAQPGSNQGIPPQMSRYGQADQSYNSQRASEWQQNLDRQGPSVGQTAAETPGFDREQPQNGRSSRWGPPNDTSDPKIGKPSDTPGSSAAQYQMDSTRDQANSSRRSESDTRQPFDQGRSSNEPYGAEGYRMDQEQPYNQQPPWLRSDRDRGQYDMREMGRQFERHENREQMYDRPNDTRRPYERPDDRLPTPQRPEDYRESQMNRPRTLLDNPPLDRLESDRREPLLSNPDEATKEPLLNRPKSLLDLPNIQPTKAMPPYDRSEASGTSSGPTGRDPGYDRQSPAGLPAREPPLGDKPGLLGPPPADRYRDPGFDERDRQQDRPFNRTGLLGDQPSERYLQKRGDGQGRSDAGYSGRDDDFRSDRGRFMDNQKFDDPYFRRESGEPFEQGRRGLLMPPEGGRFGEPAAPQGGFDPGRPGKRDSPDDEFISMAWPPTEDQEETEGNSSRSHQPPLLGEAPGVPRGGMDERNRDFDRPQFDRDRREPLHSMDRRGLGMDNRGMPYDMDRYGPGSRDLDRQERDPYDIGRAGPRDMESHGSRYDMDRSGRPFDADRLGLPHDMDRSGLPLDMNRSGLPLDMNRQGPPDTDRRGPSGDRWGPSHDMDRRGPLQDTDGRGPPHDMAQHGPPRDTDGRGPPREMDGRAPPYDMDRRGGPPLDMNRHGPIDRHDPRYDMDTAGPSTPQDMNRRGPQYDIERGGLPHDMDRRGLSQDMNRRGSPHDTDRRGPLLDRPVHDMNRRGPLLDIDTRGPQHDMDTRGPQAQYDMGTQGPQHDTDTRGPLHGMGTRGPLHGMDRSGHDIDSRGPPQELVKQGLLPTMQAQGQPLDKDSRGLPSDKQKSSVDAKTSDKKEEKEEIFVRLAGLPLQTSFRDITAFLSGVRIARDGIKLGKDNHDQPSGEGFVKLASKRDCSDALRKHRQFMGRRCILVNHCSEEEWLNAGRPSQANKPKTSSPTTQRSQSPSKAGGRSPSRKGRSPPRSSSNRSHSPRSRSRGHSPSRSRGSSPGRGNRGYSGRGKRSRSRSPIKESTTCLELKGLPSDVKEKDIIDFLRGIALVPNSIFIDVSEDGKPKGNAYARLANQRDMRLALDKDGRSIGRRRISVRDVATKIMQVKVGEIQRISRLVAMKEKKQQQESKTAPKEEKKSQPSPPKAPAKVAAKVEAKVEPKSQPKNQPNQKNIASKPDQESKKSSQAPPPKKEEKPPAPLVSKPEPRPLLSIPIAQELQQQHQQQQQQQQKLKQPQPQSQQKQQQGLLPLPTPRQQAPSNPTPMSGVNEQGPNQESTDVNARTCIHVRNLPFHVSENEVLNFFRDLDIIPPGLVFMLNPDGSPSGHAYMALSSNAEATKAGERRQGLIRGRKIIISIVPRYAMLQAIGLGHTISQPPQGAGPQGAGPQGAGPQGAGPQGVGPQRPGPLGPGSQGPGLQKPGMSVPPPGARSTPPNTPAPNGNPNGNQSTPKRQPLIPESPQSPDGRHPIPLPPLAVLIEQRRIVEATNLPFDVSVAGVVELFQNHNVIPESVRFKNGPGGRPTGAAIAAFVTPKDAQKAIEDLSNKPVVGRTGSSRTVRLHLLKPMM